MKECRYWYRDLSRDPSLQDPSWWRASIVSADGRGGRRAFRGGISSEGAKDFPNSPNACSALVIVISSCIHSLPYQSYDVSSTLKC